GGDGVLIEYTYIAPDNGVFNIVLSPTPGGTITAFSNYELTAPDPVIETIDLLDFSELVAGETKTMQLPVFNVGAGTVSGEVSGIIAPFSLLSGSDYFAQSESPDFVNITYSPLIEGDFSTVVSLIGSGGNAQVTLLGTAVPEGGLLFALYNLLFIICYFRFKR
ncbi:MAG: hypothetical protein KAS17_03995, partial [Victivallaceae bacterium]|nr:hypothetical protein [Victivallaceae bacterium]